MNHYSGSTGCCEGLHLKALVKEIQGYGVGGYKFADNIHRTYKKVEGARYHANGDDYMDKWHDGTWRVGVRTSSIDLEFWCGNLLFLRYPRILCCLPAVPLENQ